jgi:3-isopropylmalate dehydrogenase
MKIAVLPGDGIGPEIVAEAVKVLNALGPKFDLESAPVGGAAYDISGHPLPPATLELAKKRMQFYLAPLVTGSTTP